MGMKTMKNAFYTGLSICFILILVKEKEYILKLKEESYYDRAERKQEINYETEKGFTTAKSPAVENAEENEIQMKWTPSTEECRPVDNFVFLKKHKVASTTFKAIFRKFAKYREIPLEQTLIGPQGGCYPARINEDCWPRRHYHPANGLTYHFRWNIEQAHKIFDLKNTAIFTTIRNPMTCFESVYNYFYFKRSRKLDYSCDSPCWNRPFYQFNGDRLGISTGEFLDSLPENFDPTVSRNFRAKNFQSFELGLDHLNDDPAYIKSQMELLETQFDLVIILEHYMESIVLLKHRLCVPYEILYIKAKNTASYTPQPLNERQQATFNEFFKQDLEMYKFFNETLHKKIDAFGRDRMREEIIIAKRIFEQCAKLSDEHKNACKIKRPESEPPANITSEIVQYPSLDPKIYLKYMDENFGHCSNPSSSYGKIKSIHETGVFHSTCRSIDQPLRSNFGDYIKSTVELGDKVDNYTNIINS
ncbi:Oidioi.mRNA.OKI2018_I69.PAR.g12656.t1.cds [Oikopleura dioica]|uniref:Oidioi.mRNA.OKI2018_I69.PAR.g12656.t1.cds n=1 Tax=Oikopleura dioica TaxID=34765 RepID=A0ABN7S102_OIKDI|nr:Oidioi.mRNA.OKI2018_I69.PAR.g12656.t1.cds [Oikopleura dioica]